MKKLLLMAFLTVFTILSTKAQRCTISLNLTTQHNLDTLSAATKSCVIQGITVSGSGIINLNGLAGIDSINGPLYIMHNPDLLNLDGLSNLKTVAGEIDINNNPLIANLNGLSSLTTVGNNVRVVANNALTSVAALSNLNIIPGFLSIGQNAKLLSLTGLENITVVQGAIAFGANPLITNFDPLSKLTRVGGFLYVGQNQSLISITGLRNLKTVNDYINFEVNTALTTLAGLDSLDYRTPAYIKLIQNPLLSFCSTKSICDFMTSRINFLVEGNAEGCGTYGQIIAVCASLPVELVSFEGSNSREGNLLEWQTTWEENNLGFELQKSHNGRSFEPFASISGNGNSNIDHHYEQWDTAPYATTYYRLKQLDEDGTYAFSKMIAIKDNFANIRTNPESVRIYPNPVKDKLTIDSKNRNQPFSIRSLNGQLVRSGKFIPSQPMDISKLPNGIYLITIGKETLKILVDN